MDSGCCNTGGDRSVPWLLAGSFSVISLEGGISE